MARNKIDCGHGPTNIGSLLCVGKATISPKPPEGSGNRVHVINLGDRGRLSTDTQPIWDLSVERVRSLGSSVCPDCPALRQS